jgi:hypothetical protein
MRYRKPILETVLGVTKARRRDPRPSKSANRSEFPRPEDSTSNGKLHDESHEMEGSTEATYSSKTSGHLVERPDAPEEENKAA